MYTVQFIFIEIGKLLVFGPINMFVVPFTWLSLTRKFFRRKKIKMTEEESIEEKRLTMVRKANKKGFFTNSTPVMIKGREKQLEYGKIIKMDYDPSFYEMYDVDPRKLIFHVQFPGDSNVYFVNIDLLTK